MTTPSLTDFLLARYAEDEDAAQVVHLSAVQYADLIAEAEVRGARKAGVA